MTNGAAGTRVSVPESGAPTPKNSIEDRIGGRLTPHSLPRSQSLGCWHRFKRAFGVTHRFRSEASREGRERAQRELLLWAIAEAVAAKGYEAARVQDVVERSGLSRSTFYKHFHDKEECFFAAYDAAIESIWERVAGALASAGSSAGKAEAGLRALIGPLVAQPAIANLTAEMRTVGAVGRERYDRTLSRFAQLIADASGSDTRLVAEWSQLVAGGVASAIASEVREGRGAQLESLLPELVFTVLLPCVGVERALEEMRRVTGA